MLSPRSIELLRSSTLSDYVQVFSDNGLTSLAEIVSSDISEDDLRSVGVTKVFHLRKVTAIARQRWCEKHGGGGESSLDDRAVEVATSDVEFSACTPLECSQLTSDHVAVHVLACAGPALLASRDYYVKVSLCTLIEQTVVYVEGADHVRTAECRGPAPEFLAVDRVATANPMRVYTNFLGKCIAFELKEVRHLRKNVTVGVAIFPTSFFLKFITNTAMTSWFPLRNLGEDRNVAKIRLRFCVPGGCPQAVSRAYRISSINMVNRTMTISINECVILQKALAGRPPSPPPSTFIQIRLGNDRKQRVVTNTIKSTFTPKFNEAFSFSTELQNAKFVKVSLKATTGWRSASIGSLCIPIQFYLSQEESSVVNEVFDLISDNEVQARINIGLSITRNQLAPPSEDVVAFVGDVANLATDGNDRETSFLSAALSSDISSQLIIKPHHPAPEDTTECPNVERASTGSGEGFSAEDSLVAAVRNTPLCSKTRRMIHMIQDDM